MENTKKKRKRKTYKCRDCNAPITRFSKNGRCVKCSHIAQRTRVRPPKERLEELLVEYNFSAIGRLFNVSDNSIRKWCRYYNISDTSKNYKVSKEKLKELLIENNFSAVGRMFNVSDDVIRKWCRCYNMSDRAKDYKI